MATMTGTGAEATDTLGGHLTDEVMERQLKHGLSTQEAKAVQAHLDGCEACRERGKVLLTASEKSQREAYALAKKKAAEAATLRKRQVENTTSRWWLLLVGAVIAFVAYLGGVTRGVYGVPATPMPAPTVELRRTASGQLTASVQGRGATFLLLYSRQADGAWTLAWPLDKATSGSLASRGRTSPNLPEGAEEVLAVFSRTPLPVAPTLEALQRSPGHPTLPDAWVVQVPVAPK
jgi:hypothetical protein